MHARSLYWPVIIRVMIDLRIIPTLFFFRAFCVCVLDVLFINTRILDYFVEQLLFVSTPLVILHLVFSVPSASECFLKWKYHFVDHLYTIRVYSTCILSGITPCFIRTICVWELFFLIYYHMKTGFHSFTWNFRVNWISGNYGTLLST